MSVRAKTLEEWTNEYAQSLDQEWPLELWNSAWRDGINVLRFLPVIRMGQRANIDNIPQQCLAMPGFLDELRAFGTTAVYVRHDYIEILKRIVALVQGAIHVPKSSKAKSEKMPGPEGDEEVEDEDEEARVDVQQYTSHIPENPFTRMQSKFQCEISVTGSPGNGKSLFQHFILGLRLNAKRPTIVQFQQDCIYLFAAHGVFTITGATLEDSRVATRLGLLVPDAWCLVDSNLDMILPTRFVRNTLLTVIQAASAREKRLDWLGKGSAISCSFCISPFTFEEAIIVRSFRVSNLLAGEEELRSWFDRYAPFARLAFNKAFDQTTYQTRIEKKLNRLTSSSFADAARQAEAILAPETDASPHELFVFYPDSSYLFDRATCRIPTSYLTSLVIRRFESTVSEERTKFYKDFLGIKPLAAVAGHFLEDIVVDHLPLGGLWKLRELEARNARKNQHWSIGPAASALWLVVAGSMRIYNQRPALISAHPREPVLKKLYTELTASDLIDNCLYVPKSPTEPTYDFFYYCKSRAIMFQCTVADEHDVKDQGLAKLKSIGVETFTYVGIVPFDKRPNFRIHREVAERYQFESRYMLNFEVPK
ncbi:uncharacterized protein FIBRA_01911 [Fibroporia radiculosa]|uniref:Uncharacterized protein n=1 Tax=Fibroporia radiculosa TaxID=599839 RepID=J4I8R8_9APHY|nr:uncharacterized protein FIBRA_01911 [Fibroporia radiculosa]CCL99886.1 predicted protein [Fibroporia radiculosa]